MHSILNKTHIPLKVPLPRGKVLHLGPDKTGQLHDHAVDHPPIKKLVEAGKIEIIDEGAHGAGAQGDTSSVHASTHGKGPNTTMQKTGDR
ncbi:MAG: hypothetical protein GY719_14540 [bacterium]|nr:hypothetical protein [bacterium]